MLLKKKLAVLLAAAMMVVATMAAAPAFAEGKSDFAPNCETGQFTASGKQATNNSENDNPGKHFIKGFGCLFR